MKPIDPHAFDRKLRGSAPARRDVMTRTMIRTQMNRSDWLILGIARADLGRRLLLHRRRRAPRAAADLCLAAPDDRRGRDVGCSCASRARSSACRAQAWGSILLLALLNNALPFTLFGWGQTHIASGLASILNATTPIWGVVVAHFLTARRADDPAQDRRRAARLRRRRDDDRPVACCRASAPAALAQLACVTASLSYALAAVWARRFRRQGISPLSVTTGQLTAGALIMLPMSMIVDQPWTHAFPPLTRLGARSSRWRCSAPPSATCSISG